MSTGQLGRCGLDRDQGQKLGGYIWPKTASLGTFSSRIVLVFWWTINNFFFVLFICLRLWQFSMAWIGIKVRNRGSDPNQHNLKRPTYSNNFHFNDYLWILMNYQYLLFGCLHLQQIFNKTNIICLLGLCLYSIWPLQLFYM